MNEEGIRLRIGDLLHAVNKRKFVIIGMMIAGIIVGLIASGVSYLRGDISRNYVITSSVALNSRVESGSFSSSGAYPNNTDYHLAEDMIDAAIYILNSEKTLTKAFETYHLPGVVQSDVKNNLTLSQYESTLIIEETLYWSDDVEGESILSAINNVGTSVLQETMNVGGINVINPPSSTRVMGGNLNVTFCLFLGFIGLVAGIGLAVLEVLLRPTILNPNDIEESFGKDILGIVPYSHGYAKYKGSLLTRDKAIAGVADSFSSAAHIVNNIAARGGAHQCIFVTSSTRGEGTTMTVANLAVQLSDMEKKVLMVDFNFDNPRLGRKFVENIAYENSLNGLYRGDINEVEAITALSGYLDLLPAVTEKGVTLSVDSNLIGLLKKLSLKYDYILIDTAPAGLSSNTLQLREIADSAIMVMRYDFASIKEIQATVTKLEKSGVNILGCIANAVRGGNITNSNVTNAYTERRDRNVRAARPESIVGVMDEKKTSVTNTGLSSDVSDRVPSDDKTHMNSYTDMLRHLYDLDQTEEGGADQEHKK